MIQKTGEQDGSLLCQTPWSQSWFWWAFAESKQVGGRLCHHELCWRMDRFQPHDGYSIQI